MKKSALFGLGFLSGVAAMFAGLHYWQTFPFLWHAVLDVLTAAGFPITLG